jgi:hypothetical protein
VIVSVTRGELPYLAADDCVQRAYPAGSVFVDPGLGHVHTAFNGTRGETVIVVMFFESPEQGPLLIPAGAPADCNL